MKQQQCAPRKFAFHPGSIPRFSDNFHPSQGPIETIGEFLHYLGYASMVKKEA